jgi:hypothetical protein
LDSIIKKRGNFECLRYKYFVIKGSKISCKNKSHSNEDYGIHNERIRKAWSRKRVDQKLLRIGDANNDVEQGP